MEPIYLDHAATTPLRPEVREAMVPYLNGEFGNPSSIHRWGRSARAKLEEARERLAAVLGATRAEVVFTGGGTEADNLAVLGRWRAAAHGGAAVVCSAVEHSGVFAAAQSASREGAALVLLGVDSAGRVDPAELDEALAADGVAVVSVMWGNNEVGTLQPVAEIAARCGAAGVPYHADAVQALGKVPVRVDEVPVDLVAVSAHKIGGPNGVGALYVREGVELSPLLHGGGQERAIRPGTQNVAGAVGFALAAELAERERDTEATRLAKLRDRLESGLRERVPGLIINGAPAPRLPHVLNVSLPDVDQEAILIALDLEGIAASSGSACHSGSVEPSRVLLAMGRAGDAAAPEASVRFSLGRTTTGAEIERALEVVPAIAQRVCEQAVA